MVASSDNPVTLKDKPTVSSVDKKPLSFSSSEDPMCAYLLTEVSVFNNRVVWYLEQQQKQEIFALGASGVLWAYLLKGEGELFSLAVAFVPPLVSLTLFAKSYIMTKAMGESMDYLEKLENSFELKNELGWVHYYKKNTSNYKKKWRTYFWIGLSIINILICVIFINHNSTKAKLTPSKVSSSFNKTSLQKNIKIEVHGKLRIIPEDKLIKSTIK